jgi:DMSO/TMAO reductase YedYZ molybdopterin-dependent catalytic subunit
MSSVKWLRRVTAVSEPFEGFQMNAYRLRQDPDDPGAPTTKMQPRALMIPPGFPDFFARMRTLDAGPCILAGRAWSGWASVTRVEVSTDGGRTWREADLEPAPGRFAWARWSLGWDASAGNHELVVRASDDAGNVQPVDQPWNYHGLANNMAQRVPVSVR